MALVQLLLEAFLKKLGWFIESGLVEDPFHQCSNHQYLITSIAWWYDWFDSLFALKQSKDDSHFWWRTSSTTAKSIFEETGLIYWKWACWGSISSKSSYLIQELPKFRTDFCSKSKIKFYTPYVIFKRINEKNDVLTQ